MLISFHQWLGDHPVCVQSWLAELGCLTAAQWLQLEQAVHERNEGVAAVAAIELPTDAERRCRHCC